jgi:hypothetical protein
MNKSYSIRYNVSKYEFLNLQIKKLILRIFYSLSKSFGFGCTKQFLRLDIKYDRNEAQITGIGLLKILIGLNSIDKKLIINTNHAH